MRIHLRHLLLLLSLLWLGCFVVAAQDSTNCKLSPRLVVGARARALLENYAHDLRSEPRANGQLIVTFPENSVLKVLEGPICADSFNWWRVDYQGSVGWVAETTSDYYLYDPIIPFTTSNADQLSPLIGLGRGVFTSSVKWSPDGETIAVGSTVGTWRFSTDNLNKPPQMGNGLNAPIDALTFSDDDTERIGMATCTTRDDQGKCLLSEIYTFGKRPPDDNYFGEYVEYHYTLNAFVHQIVFIPNRKLVAAAAQNEVLLLLPKLQGEPTLIWRGSDRIVALEVSADGQWLAASDGRRVILVRLDDSQFPREALDIGMTGIAALAFSHNSTRLAIGSSTGQIILWDVPSKTRLGMLDNLGRKPNMQPTLSTDLEFSRDGQLLVSANLDGTLSLFRVNTSGLLQIGLIDPLINDPITSLALSPDGKQVAFISTYKPSNTLHIWDIASGQPVATLEEGHTGLVVDAAFNPDGTTLLTVGGKGDGSVRMWDVLGRKQTQILRDGSNGAAVAYSPDGSLFAALYETSDATTSQWNLELWDAQTLTSRIILLGKAFGTASSLAFSPDGQLLASDIQLSAPNTVAIWKVANLLAASPATEVPPLLSVPVEGSITSLAFSPNGSPLAIASVDEGLRGDLTLVDTALYRPQLWRQAHEVPIWQVAFSPDGQWIASAGSNSGRGGAFPTERPDMEVRLWNLDPSDGGILHLSHQAGVNTLAFNPDGTLLATGDVNGDLHLWNMTTGEKIRSTYNRRFGAINRLTFNQDNDLLAVSIGTFVLVQTVYVGTPYGMG